MCVPSYSVCLKGPQEKCVCCWHSPFNIVWIFHQDPSPVTRALCFQTCLYIPCVCAHVCVCACVCAHACTCACLQRGYTHLFSLKCKILCIPLPLCTHSYVYRGVNLFIFLCVFCILEIWESAAEDSRPGTGHPAANSHSFAAPFVQGTLTQPWMQVSAGYWQSLGKERGVALYAWKKCTRLKIVCPPVNASPLKTAGLGSCLHSAMYKLILTLCRRRVTTPPLLPPFVACFVREPSQRQSQPHKKSSFWIHWPPMNSGNLLFGASIHKLVLTHWILSSRLKKFFTERFLLRAVGRVLSNHPWR